MKSTNAAAIFLLPLILFSCMEDEKELAPIVGKWRGNMAELEVKPFSIPLPISQTDENFNTEIEFTKAGTVVLLSESPAVTGTYQLNGDQLTTDINFNFEMIDPGDPFTVQELTERTLVIYLEKKDTIQDPDTGKSISGDIKITVHFERF